MKMIMIGALIGLIALSQSKGDEWDEIFGALRQGRQNQQKINRYYDELLREDLAREQQFALQEQAYQLQVLNNFTPQQRAVWDRMVQLRNAGAQYAYPWVQKIVAYYGPGNEQQIQTAATEGMTKEELQKLATQIGAQPEKFVFVEIIAKSFIPYPHSGIVFVPSDVFKYTN
jgi:hypothetical protein